MSEFRRVTESFWATPQISVADVEEARRQGFALIVNNRPDGESPDQPEGESIAAAAHRAGIAYRAIPVTPGGFDEAQVSSMVEALASAEGRVLAFCRSGTRSTLLWGLAQAMQGRATKEIAAEAASAGYDVAPVRGILDRLRARHGGL